MMLPQVRNQEGVDQVSFFELPLWLVLKINNVLNPLYFQPPFFHVETEKCSTKRRSLRLRSKTERVVQPRKRRSYR